MRGIHKLFGFTLSADYLSAFTFGATQLVTAYEPD